MKKKTINTFQKVIFISSFYFAFLSCKTVSVQQQSQTTTTKNLVLGNVGIEKSTLINPNFKPTTQLYLDTPIKISATAIPFSKQTYKAFTEAEELRTNVIKISYSDSLVEKPSFVNLKLSDHVTLIRTINNNHNTELNNYLKIQKEARIVTSITLALQYKDVNAIVEADAIFLRQDAQKTYQLKLYKNNKLTQSIGFNQGVVFAYNASGFCWQENKKRQLKVVDIVEGNKGCPNKTYRSAKSAETPIDYYKF